MTHTSIKAIALSLLMAAGCAHHDHEHDHASGDEHEHADEHGHEHADEHGHEHPDEHGQEHGAESSVGFTAWTDTHEYFAEASGLEPGHASSWLVHATALRDFGAVMAPRMELMFTSGGATHTASADLLRPGIYRIEAPPLAAGSWTVSVTIPDEAETSVMGEFAIPLPEAVPDAEDDDGISFLKEQQWLVSFGTEFVQRAPIRSTISALGWVASAPGASAQVRAPAAGLVQGVERDRVRPGAVVTAGEVLGTIQRAPTTLSRPDTETALAEARATLAYAESELVRITDLAASGVIGRSRVLAAQLERDRAAAALRGAESARRELSVAEGAGGGGAAAPIVAPMSGVVVASSLLDGVVVTEGEMLLEIADPEQGVLDVHVPENSIALLPHIESALVQLSGMNEPVSIPIAQPIAHAGRVDTATHTLEVQIPLGSMPTRAVLGQSARVLLVHNTADDAVVIPRTALSDEDGMPVVYVQLEGELFERRGIRMGRRDGDSIEVLSGLEAGERLVTEGAWLLRLASGSTSMPSHGHAH